MNQGMIAGAIALFVVPVAIAVCLNYDNIAPDANEPTVPQGTLIYFYADW